MKIDGKKISESILTNLKEEVLKMSIKPKLVVVTVKPDAQNYSFIKIKESTAKKIGCRFEMVRFKKTPRFEEFARELQFVAEAADTSGVVIQKPLPSSLSTETLFNYVPLLKEIEGNKYKTPFHGPIGLAVLTILKVIYDPLAQNNIKNLIINELKDGVFFKKILKRKRVVLVGRGETGGRPIGKVLSFFRINYINIFSTTPSKIEFIKNADIIITAVGKKIIDPSFVKSGAILINVGLRAESGLLKGDYDEDEIKKVAGFYTPTPGGIGPLDVSYLMYNLVKAAKLQHKKK